MTDSIRAQQMPLTGRLNWFDASRGKSSGKIIPVLSKSSESPFSLRFQVEKRVTEGKGRTRGGKKNPKRAISLFKVVKC